MNQGVGSAGLVDVLRSLIADDSSAGFAGTHLILLLRIANLDKLGFIHGFEYTQSLSGRLSKLLKTQLRDRDSVHRIGDRDIGVVLPGVASASILGLAVNKINTILSDYSQTAGAGAHFRVYIGASVFPRHGEDARELYRSAYLAMLCAERGCLDFLEYSAENRRIIQREVDIEEELLKSVGNYEFELFYQPQLDLESGKITSAEVLLRWNSARLGFVPPDLFIPIAEKNGLINDITEWIIQKALNFHSEFFSAGHEFNLAINLSPVNLKDRSLPDFIEQSLGVWGVPASRLTLELTEGAMLDQPAQARDMLEQLKSLGVTLSIDDFGTGYSSLQYIGDLPVDELKIDKSFILDMATNEKNRRIVKSVLDLAKNFDLDVVAEGVEDDLTMASLKQMGCNKAQGYCISRPLSEANFRQYVSARNDADPLR